VAGAKTGDESLVRFELTVVRGDRRQRPALRQMVGIRLSNSPKSFFPTPAKTCPASACG
jgi:hypothetical protein